MCITYICYISYDPDLVLLHYGLSCPCWCNLNPIHGSCINCNEQSHRTTVSYWVGKGFSGKGKEALLFLHGGPKSVGSWCWVAHISYKGQPSTLHSFLLTPLFTAIHFAICFLSRVEEVAHLQHIGKIFSANVDCEKDPLQPHIVTSIGSLVICESKT